VEAQQWEEVVTDEKKTSESKSEAATEEEKPKPAEPREQQRTFGGKGAERQK
jgi:hypothetical protein